jgi:asparagine synthase (glutamine-hydrolysing)
MYGRNRLLDYGRGRSGHYAATVLSPLRLVEGGLARADLPSADRPLEAPLAEYFSRAEARDALTQLTLVDVETYLPGDILTKVDRMSMAVSLEARVPLLDHHVIEFALSLPDRLKLRDGTGKWLLRRAVEPMVPPRVLAKRKQGFAVPIRHWFRNELRHRVESLLRPDSPIYAYVDRTAAQRTAAEHLGGRRDHAGALWRMLVLDLWLRRYAA